MLTNKKLHLYGIKDSNKCENCVDEAETIIHLFCDCPKNCSIWKNIVDWLNSLGYRLGYFTDVQILFGDKKFDPIVNKVIIASKYLIFKQKTKTSAVTFKKLLYFLKSESEIERGIATNNNQFRRFWGLWSPIWKSIKNPAHYI